MNKLEFNSIQFNHIGHNNAKDNTKDIKLTTKSIKITDNGIFNVKPDSGCAFSSVSIVAEIPFDSVAYFKTTPEFISLLEKYSDCVRLFSSVAVFKDKNNRRLDLVSDFLNSDKYTISDIKGFSINFSTIFNYDTNSSCPIGIYLRDDRAELYSSMLDLPQFKDAEELRDYLISLT